MNPTRHAPFHQAPGRQAARCSLTAILLALTLCACQRVRVQTHPVGVGVAAPGVALLAAPTEGAPTAGEGGATPRVPIITPTIVPEASRITPSATRPVVIPTRAPLLASTATPVAQLAASPAPTAALPTPAIPLAEAPPSELRIPSIRLSAPIVPVGWYGEGKEITWQDPGSSVGWVDSSALPGERSNVVLAGHHNIRGEVFRELVNVAVGDEVLLRAGDVTYRYVVQERFIIPEKHASEAQREQNALWIAPTTDERLTMLTCWPYRDNTHRLIVIAMPAPTQP